jgi:hypothetical protein
MIEQRQRALEIAKAQLAESPDDPNVQSLVESMQAELDRFEPHDQEPGS